MSNVLNVGINYVMEYLFDLLVDLALERYRLHAFSDKWHFNF